jgi:glucose-1-phosphate thymidylyltransferase
VARREIRTRVQGHAIRSINVLIKGVVVVPNTTPWTGPWLGVTRATSLQRVANRPIICHVLDALLDAGVVEVAVIAPPDVADEVAACVGSEGPAGLEIHHLIDEQGDGNDALRAAAELVGDAPGILHRADGLQGQPLSSFVELLRSESSDALLLVQDDGREARRLRLVPQRLLSAGEDGLMPAAHGVAGVCLLGPGALQRMANPEPSAQVLDFAALAQKLVRDGGRVHMRVVRTWRHFAGDALDLLDMNRTMLDALDGETTAVARDGNRFEGHIAIHPSACVTSSVVIGPVIIGADALIADSYIGPHTSIAERVRIEGAELERSIVLADASVLHVGGRLVASIVGRQARIFRDFSVPRALRLQVGDGDEVALC